MTEKEQKELKLNIPLFRVNNMTEEQILALNDPTKSYWYCVENKDANIKLHEDVIVNSKYVGYVYDFAKYIVGANIERLQEIIINSNDTYYIYSFAYYVKKSNKEELFKALLKTGNKYYINEFIKNIELPEELKKLVVFI